MGSECQVETVVESPTKDLGRLVSLKIDGVGDPHIAYFRVTNRSPLNSVITYARGRRPLTGKVLGVGFRVSGSESGSHNLGPST